MWNGITWGFRERTDASCIILGEKMKCPSEWPLSAELQSGEEVRSTGLVAYLKSSESTDHRSWSFQRPQIFK